ncbi:MAG: adenosine deaminase, partial [Chloroflexaceae bacterium]|nr:adenosine deaminase [Chloroflexaceae bacterium]
IAWSIGGNEIGHPPEPFADVFAAARSVGLHVMAHAGEVVGAESVWGAVHDLHVERIGHGIRSIEDPALVAYLRDHAIALDICLSSNSQTGAVTAKEHHPFRQLYDSNLLLTINSDDPTFFQTTLTDEYRHAVYDFGLKADDLCRLVLYSIRASFLPIAEKTALLHRVEMDLAMLRTELGV